MIDGVVIKQLRRIPDERGCLTEMLRSDDDIFEKFGQTYFTTTYPGVVKAWHYHKSQVDYFVCVRGMVKLVLYDPREDSPTKGEVQELFVGERNMVLVRVPRHVYHGWKCVSEEEAIVVNVPTEPFDREEPDEYRLPWDTDQIPYDWEIKFG